MQEVKQVGIEQSGQTSDSGKRVVDVVEHVVRNEAPSEFRLTPSAIAVILAIVGATWIVKSEINEGRIETVRLIEHVKVLDKRMDRLEMTVYEIKDSVVEIKETFIPDKEEQ